MGTGGWSGGEQRECAVTRAVQQGYRLDYGIGVATAQGITDLDIPAAVARKTALFCECSAAGVSVGVDGGLRVQVV